MPGYCIGLQYGNWNIPVPGCNCRCCQNEGEEKGIPGPGMLQSIRMDGWNQQQQLGPSLRPLQALQSPGQQQQTQLGPQRRSGQPRQQQTQLEQLLNRQRYGLERFRRQWSQQLEKDTVQSLLRNRPQPGPERPLGQPRQQQLPQVSFQSRSQPVRLLATPAQQQRQQQQLFGVAPPTPRLNGKLAHISHDGKHSQGALKAHYFIDALIKFSAFKGIIEGFICHQDVAVDGCLTLKGGYRKMLIGGEAGLRDIICSCFEAKSTGLPWEDNPVFTTRRSQLEHIEAFCLDSHFVFIWTDNLDVDERDGARLFGRSPDERVLQFEVLRGVHAALVPSRSVVKHFKQRLISTNVYNFPMSTKQVTELPDCWQFDPFLQATEAVVRLIGGATWWDSLGPEGQQLWLSSGQLPPFQHGAFMPFQTRPYPNTGYKQWLGKGALAKLGWQVVELPSPGGAASGLVVGLPDDLLTEWRHLLPDNLEEWLAELERYGIEIRVGGSTRETGSVELALTHESAEGIITKDPGHLQAFFAPMPDGLLWVGSGQDWSRLTDGNRRGAITIPDSFRAHVSACRDMGNASGDDFIGDILRTADLLVDPKDPKANREVAIACGLIKLPRTSITGVPVALTYDGYTPNYQPSRRRYVVQPRPVMTRTFYFGPKARYINKEAAEAAAVEYARNLWREDYGVRSEAEEAVWWSQ